MTDGRIRTLIADDHAIVRMGLISLLKSEPDLDVVGEADDGTSAIKKARQLKPDVAIIDLMMPEMDGIAATKEILRHDPGIKVLILTTSTVSDELARALEAGASGVIIKNYEYAELISAIHNVHNGQNAISPEIRRMIAEDPPLPTLSNRQKEILQSVTRGLTNADIAKQLSISPDMVKEHLNALFSKIGAANKAEAVAIALRKHLLKI